MRDMVEIGMGRTARRTYELGDINIVPTDANGIARLYVSGMDALLAKGRKADGLQGRDRLRLRVLHVAARLVATARQHWLRLPRGWPWTDLIVTGHHRLRALT